MAIKIFSCVAQGLEGKLIEVEVDILQGLPAFSIVGLGDAAVQEAKERVRSAIKNSGAQYPQQKKIINLAPAHLRKHGPQFDLPMAVGLLIASDQLPLKIFEDTLLIGELALDGGVRPINGILTMVLFAKQSGWKKIILPAENSDEAQLVKGLEIFPLNHLSELIDYAKNGKLLSVAEKTRPIEDKAEAETHNAIIDFADIKGQDTAKRALEIAAAGAHHVLFTGPPGVGKTMLAKALPGILPPLEENEAMEVMQIYSCAGLFQASNIQNSRQLMRRPFRQVHSGCSLVALIGGGAQVKPGEISFAHRGILFLDEVAEFPRSHLEALRQPLEEKSIQLARSFASIQYPAHFTLIASMNPCPCGYFGDPQKQCHCPPYKIIQYQKKLSGPLRDRLDLVVEVPRQPLSKYQETASRNSAEIGAKIANARKIQWQRFKSTNCEMSPSHIKIHCKLSKENQNFLMEAGEKFNFSGRNYHQLLKVARTIADLNGHDHIQLEDLSEALQFRHREK